MVPCPPNSSGPFIVCTGAFTRTGLGCFKHWPPPFPIYGPCRQMPGEIDLIDSVILERTLGAARCVTIESRLCHLRILRWQDTMGAARQLARKIAPYRHHFGHAWNFGATDGQITLVAWEDTLFAFVIRKGSIEPAVSVFRHLMHPNYGGSSSLGSFLSQKNNGIGPAGHEVQSCTEGQSYHWKDRRKPNASWFGTIPSEMERILQENGASRFLIGKKMPIAVNTPLRRRQDLWVTLHRSLERTVSVFPFPVCRLTLLEMMRLNGPITQRQPSPRVSHIAARERSS
jgi:hypothetical protein